MEFNKDMLIKGTVIVLLFLAVLWGAWKALTVPVEQKVTEIPITESDWSLGNPQAPVTIIEFSDFQCPTCAAVAPMVGQIVEANKDTVRFIYKHFPLTQIHANSEAASLAAESAGLQGKFFEMSERIFIGQSDWEDLKDPTEIFVGYAEALELDMEQFKSNLKNNDLLTKIQNDSSTGIAAGVGGTPTFFINGKKIDIPRSNEAFQQLIDAELAATGTQTTQESDTPTADPDQPTDAVTPDAVETTQ